MIAAQRLAIVLLLALPAVGCKRIPEVPQPIDPAPHDYWTEDPTAAELQEQVATLHAQTRALTLRVNDMGAQLELRNDELQRTRVDHERALEEIAEVRRRLADWQQTMERLEDRLGGQDQERLDLLGEIADRIQDISRSVSR